MIRYIDDMLFISPSLKDAVGFVDLVSAGFSEYGFEVNATKSMANFEHPLIARQIPLQACMMPWCGLLVDQQTLEIRADYSKFFGCCILVFFDY